MMVNQGEHFAESVVSLEKHQINESYEIQTASYYSSNTVASWNTQGKKHSLRGNGVFSSSTDNHHQQVESNLKNVHNVVNLAPIVATSSSEPAIVSHGYSGSAVYPSANPYGYSTEYAVYYNQYQQQFNHSHQQAYQYQQQSNQYPQQSNQTYPHHVGAYQNSGAAYRPLSSFQKSGSYAGSESYPRTYYNTGYYQTAGSYTTGTYGTQTNFRYGGQYPAYSFHHCQNYTPDSSSSYGSATAGTTSQFQQNYKQWADHYNHTQTEVTCAPRTENVSVSIASGSGSFIPSGSSGYTVSSSQVPAAYTPLKMVESISSELTLVQPVAVSGSTLETCRKIGAASLQNDMCNSALPHSKKPPETPPYETFQNLENSTECSTVLYQTSYQVSQSYQLPVQTACQPRKTLDSHRKTELQIPTNPRIPSSLSSSVSKPDNEASMTNTVEMPAYCNVSVKKPNEGVILLEEADSVLKPEVFPNSLRDYIARALVRCKNDGQKAVSQGIIKEVIKNAIADGTLHSRDWDTQPLFPMPNIDAYTDQDKVLLILAKPKSRRLRSKAKRRVGPIPEEKVAKKSTANSVKTAKDGAWSNEQISDLKTHNKDNLGTEISPSDHENFSKHDPRPTKRPHLGDFLSLDVASNDETSSDSNQEQSSAKYYSAATAQWNSQQERKRQEKPLGRHQIEKKVVRSKDPDAGNLYKRRATSMVLSRTFEENGSRAVEDIDWDSLTAMLIG